MIIIKYKKILAVGLVFLQIAAAQNLIFAGDSSIASPATVTQSGNVINVDEGINNRVLFDNDTVLFSSDEKYNTDLSNLEYTTPVRNQGRLGLCWDFTSTACFESAVMKANGISKITTGNEDEYDFSELHAGFALSNYFLEDGKYGFLKEFADGGNASMYNSYIKREKNASSKLYSGPVKERDMPYPAKTEDYGYTSDVDGKMDLPELDYMPGLYSDITIYSSSNLTKLSDSEIQARNNIIKNAVKTYGNVSVSVYCGESSDNAEQGFETFTKNDGSKDTLYYFNDCSTGTNHMVTIVGYDDTYPAENFAVFNLPVYDEYCSASKPVNNGAFICKNSWGTDWGENNGYFYMSYDSVIFTYDYWGNVIDKSEIDNVYDYSPYVNMGSRYFYHTDEQAFASEAVCANEFDAKGVDENITRIGTTIKVPNTYVKFYVNENADDSEKFNNLNEVKVKIDNPEMSAAKDGYYLIKTPGSYIFELETPIKVTGEKFMVGIDYGNDIENASIIPCEVNSEEYLATKTEARSYSEATLENLKYFGEVVHRNYDIDIKAYTKEEEVKKDIAIGDINGDGEFTSEDAVLLLNKVLRNDTKLGIEKYVEDINDIIDVDDNGKVTALDAAMVAIKANDPYYVFPREETEIEDTESEMD